MENNRYSVKMRLWLGHITWLHIHATFEEDTSAVISKTSLNKKDVT